MKKSSLVLFGILLFLCSCSFPHWIVSHRNVIVDAATENEPEIVQVSEMKKSKSHYNIQQYFRTRTLTDVSEESFSVLYNGKVIRPKVYACFPNEGFRRLTGLSTIPPMTLMSFRFKVKRQQGDTILIIEHDIPQKNDSIVIKLEIPEMTHQEDSLDWYNFTQLSQLHGYYRDPTETKGLYHDLQFEDGVCVREFTVSNVSVYKSILHGGITENMKDVMNEDEVPKNTLSFYLGINHYFICISNDCDLSYLKSEKKDNYDEIKIRVRFFENVKQPYNNKYPFAIIESISKE